MGKLVLLAPEMLDRITSNIDIFALFALYATGDNSLIRSMINGGVTEITIRSVALGELAIWKSFSSKAPYLLHIFKHLRKISFGTACPNGFMQLPQHLLSKLQSLAVNTSSNTHHWSSIMDSAVHMDSLQSLSYSIYALAEFCETDDEFDDMYDAQSDGSDDVLPEDSPTSIELPPNLINSLTYLNIGTSCVYDLGDLPKFLTSFTGNGRINGISRNSEEPHAETSTIKFPDTLADLKFTFSTPEYIGHSSDQVEVLSIIPLCISLPKSLLSLHITHRMRPNPDPCIEPFVHLLPRSLTLLHMGILSIDRNIMFEDLPPTLTTLTSSLSIYPKTEAVVSLPKSLTYIYISSGFDISSWLPKIEFTNPALSIEGVHITEVEDLSYFKHESFSVDMIASMDTIPNRIMELFNACKFGRGIRSLYISDENVNAENFCQLMRSSPKIEEVDLNIRSSSQIDFNATFGCYPHTLVHLGIQGFSDSINGIDLKELVPHLKSLSYSSKRIMSESMNRFQPKTLPDLREISVRNFKVNLNWLLLALPDCIQECYIEGMVDISGTALEIESIIPLSLGSSTSSGVVLDIGDITLNDTVDRSIVDCNFIKRCILKNRHVIQLKFKLEDDSNQIFFSNFKKRSSDSK